MTGRQIIFLSLVLSFVFVITPVSASAQKVTVSPTEVTLAETGGEQIFSITLDEPIIAESGDPLVTITLTSNDNRAVLNTQTITFTGSEWFQTRHFTVTTLDDTIVNSSNLVTIRLSVSSNSEYYNNYTSSALVTLIDNDTAPVRGYVSGGSPDMTWTPEGGFVYHNVPATTQTVVVQPLLSKPITKRASLIQKKKKRIIKILRN